MSTDSNAYAAAGVNLAAGEQVTDLITAAVRSTYGPEVLAGIGAFGGLFDAAHLRAMQTPVLVASTDGVGTKTLVAARMQRWDTIGHDLVNHCVNDILVQGARPLFFLDYIAAAALEPPQIAAVVGGVAAACRAVGCALLGGETAEMPGVYQAGALDLVGTIVGVVERGTLIDGSMIEAGDCILGLPASGLHTNGYSLARAALAHLDWTTPHADLGVSIGAALLAPHRCYVEPVRRLQTAGLDIRGMAHITGGGIAGNLPRILPAGLGAVVRRGTWHEPPLFGLIQQHGAVSTAEMFRVFNMGLGMVLVVPPEQAALARATLPDGVRVVGEITEDHTEVVIDER